MNAALHVKLNLFQKIEYIFKKVDIVIAHICFLEKNVIFNLPAS